MGSKNQSLPGMESRDIPELEQAADAYVRVRDERCALSKKESEAKATLIHLMEQKGRTYYSYNGLVIQLSNKQNVKVNSKDEDDEEPVGRFSQPRRERAEKAIAQTKKELGLTEQQQAIDSLTEYELEADGTWKERDLAAAAECFCGHLACDHEENGACRVIGEGGAPCDCDGFTLVHLDEERERLHKDAVARWRRERPASVEEVVRKAKKFSEIMADEDGEPEQLDEWQSEVIDAIDGDEADEGGTPFPTEYPQEEINRIAGFYCANKIAEEKPVKICYVLEQPHIITGGMSKGGDYQSVDAWPILPLENVGEENARTYKEISAEYNAMLSRKFDSDIESPHQPFTYEGMKVNCGSKAKPKWWVMIGPKMTFTVKQESPDDFTAPRCNECKRTDGGHTKECAQNPDRLTSDDYLKYAEAHYKSNHQSHARKMALTGLNDDEIRKWKLEQQQASNGAEPEPAKESKKRAKSSTIEEAIDR